MSRQEGSNIEDIKAIWLLYFLELFHNLFLSNLLLLQWLQTTPRKFDKAMSMNMWPKCIHFTKNLKRFFAWMFLRVDALHRKENGYPWRDFASRLRGKLESRLDPFYKAAWVQTESGIRDPTAISKLIPQQQLFNTTEVQNSAELAFYSYGQMKPHPY